MLRVLTLSTLFPHAARPTLGVFVERQTVGLAARADVALEVVAPVGVPVWPLSRHRHYAPLDTLPHEEQWQGLRVHRPRYRVWPRVGQAGTVARMAAALLPLLREIRTRFPFDVIDAEFFWPDGPGAVRLGAALGVPVSIKARGSDIHYWGTRPGIAAQLVAAGRAAGGLLAVSAALKRDMAALGLPDDRIAVHYTGVDRDIFHPVDRAAAKAVLGVTGPLLACAGTLMERKGQWLVMEVLQRFPDAILILIGEGPDRAILEQQAETSGLASRVRFLGPLPHAEIARHFAAADVVVQPSASEGLANVWVEAMACGTPVVTCDIGGAREAIDRPAAGRLAARTPAAFADAIADILAAPPPSAAVQAAAARFDWQANSDALFAHLSALIR